MTSRTIEKSRATVVQSTFQLVGTGWEVCRQITPVWRAGENVRSALVGGNENDLVQMRMSRYSTLLLR